MLRFTGRLKGLNRVFRTLKIHNLALYKKGTLATFVKEKEKQVVLKKLHHQNPNLLKW